MSGAALNPLATLAPATPAKATKGPDALRPEAAASEAADAPPADGFALELQRRITHEAKKEAADDAPARTSTDSDSDAGAAQPGLPATPDAALMAALLQAATPPAAPDLPSLPGGTSLPALPAASGSTGSAGLAEEADDPPLELLAPAPATAPPDATLAALAALAAATVSPPTGKAAPAAAEAPPLAANIAAGASETAGKGHRDSAAGAPASLAPLDPTQGPRLAPAEGSVAKPLELAETPAAKLAATPPQGATPPPPDAVASNSFANLHAAALANLRGEAPTPSPVPLHVATPAGSPGWPEEVGTRVRWMVGAEESHAQLTLSPPQLGKVEVSITVSGGETSAQFVAATPAARELIEQSLPRLREVLEQSGISLGQTNVGTSGQPGGSGEGRPGGAWNGRRGGDERLAEAAPASPWVRRGEGLVDTFA